MSVEVDDLRRAVAEVIAAHPDVADVAVVSLEDAAAPVPAAPPAPPAGGRGPGEGAAPERHAAPRLAAAVVPVDFASAPEIRDHAWQRLGDERSPRLVALLPALPRGPDGAVDEAELRRLLTAGDLPTSCYAAPQTAAEREVAEIIRDVLDLPRVGLDDDFLELGGDSLHAIEVVNLIEQRTGRRVSLEELFDAATVRSLLRGAEGRVRE